MEVKVSGAKLSRPCPGLKASWLAAAVPSGARRFRVSEPELREPIRTAGAILVATTPDVEIGRVRDLRWDGACIVVPLQRPVAASGGRGSARVRRGGRRLVQAIGLRSTSVRVRCVAARHGYSSTSVVRWEPGEPVYLPGLTKRPRPWARQSWGRSAVVVARRPTSTRESLLGAVMHEARRSGRALGAERVTFGASGVIVVLADDGVVRMTCGPAAERLVAHERAVRLLQAVEAPDPLAGRVPTLLDSGQYGLCQWALESRLVGSRPRPTLADRTIDDCLEFLVALFRLPGWPAPGRSVADDVAIAGACCPEPVADMLRTLAVDVEARLAAVPRGWVHGDFWSGNLLVEGDRLTGVLDWCATRPTGLPLLDVMHLAVSEYLERTGASLGDTVVERLLRPLARGNPSDLITRYCSMLAFSPTIPELEALAIAYWLDRLAQLVLDPDATAVDPRAPEWQSRNVAPVLAALVGGEAHR